MAHALTDVTMLTDVSLPSTNQVRAGVGQVGDSWAIGWVALAAQAQGSHAQRPTATTRLCMGRWAASEPASHYPWAQRWRCDLTRVLSLGVEARISSASGLTGRGHGNPHGGVGQSRAVIG